MQENRVDGGILLYLGAALTLYGIGRLNSLLSNDVGYAVGTIGLVLGVSGVALLLSGKGKQA